MIFDLKKPAPPEHMTAAEYRAMADKRIRRKKYRNVPTEVDRIVFDSKAEASRYIELRALLRSGEVRWFTRQPSFLLIDGPPDIRVRYLPDFLICDASGYIWAEDVKGVETAAFKIKRKLWIEAFPGLELRVIK